MPNLGTLAKQFQQLAKKDVLAQAYVLHGPVVAAQFAFAKELANFLETKEWQKPTNILLDAKFIDGSSQKLGVEVAREFSDFLYRQPAVSSRRTLVINNATDFTDQAQNAILKIVEEPPSHALIILTMRDVNSLLPALKSRLQAVYVAPDSTMKAALSPVEERAQEILEKFLMTSGSERSKLLKSLVDEDKESEKGEQIVDAFVRALIVELAKKPEQNTLALKELLKRQTAMGDFSTSKKLQLEAALQFLR